MICCIQTILGEDPILLPLPLLISHGLLSPNDLRTCSQDLLTRHSLELFSAGFDLLTACPTRHCPFYSVSLGAAGCGSFTRSRLHLDEGGELQGRNDTIPEYNCDFDDDSLPRDVFLERLDTYTIVVTFSLQEFGKRPVAHI